MRSRVVWAVAAASVTAGAMLITAGSAGAGGNGPPVVEVTINKVVVGADPGVAFAIVLTCSSEGGGGIDGIDIDGIDGIGGDALPGGDVSAQDFQIPNDGAESETVQLANGQSTVVNVTLPPEEPDIAECEVTEDLSDTTLPAGFSCTTPIVEPESAVVYQTNNGGASDAEFTVTNTCSAPAAAAAAVEAVPVVTG